MSDKQLPFTVVEKDDRKSPLQSNQATRCDHDRAYKSEAYPTSGITYVCADCGFKSSHPRDLD